jgi:hypothetical protein
MPTYSFHGPGSIHLAQGHMTEFLHTWRKANQHVRAGEHMKAIYWLQRAHEVLARKNRHQWSFAHELDLGYVLAATFVLSIVLIGSQL